MDQALRQAFEWIDEIFAELRLPGVSKGTFMRRPSLRHRGRSMIGSKDGQALVVDCPIDVKEVLLEAEPQTYFETDHYRGWPAILIRPERADRDLLRTRILAAWRMNATRRQIEAYEARQAGDGADG